MIVLGLLLAGLIGISLGLLGGGGSILTVPILVYVLGYGAKEAIAMSLAVVGAVAAFGAVAHARAGNVNGRIALIFGGVSMVGTFLGARIAVWMTGEAQLLLFAVVMLLAAYFMLREPGAIETGGVVSAPPPRAGWLLITIEGLAVGVLTGLVGVGGGFLIVPALVLLARIPMKEAIGTSLVVIAVKSLAGFLGYLDQAIIPWAFLALFTVFAVLGIQVGVRATRYVSARSLRKAFGVFLIVTGAWLMYENFPAGLDSPSGDGGMDTGYTMEERT